MNKTVLVVGFFDMFHSGHVEFFRSASEFGDLYVSIATDENSFLNKHKLPICNQEERKFMVESCKYVKEAFISYGRTDVLSFEPHLLQVKPDVFIINSDGHTQEKETLCKSLNIQYVVLQRLPHKSLVDRSTTNLRTINQIPLRLDFVSFFDQIKLNSKLSGRVIVANINPIDVESRSGMSTSTLKTIYRMFGNKLPIHIEKHELSKILFTLENMDKTEYISGTVDQIGICYRGITMMSFDNSYWPNKIQSFGTIDTMKWLNKYLYIVQTKPRPPDFKLYDDVDQISMDTLKNQNNLVDECLISMEEKDIIRFGKCINNVHDNQKHIFPNYESDYCVDIIKHYRRNHLGCKLMGAGGYGYVMVVSNNPEQNFLKVNITYDNM
jgi:cytidyltransferase-like protein